MGILEIGPSLIVYHILPSVLAGLVYLFLAKFFIFIFRINKPSTKYIVYLLALYKSVLLLISGARYSFTQIPRKPVGFGFVFYDPLDLLPFGSIKQVADVTKSIKALQSPFLTKVVSIVLITMFLLLILRWFATAIFFKKLANEANSPPVSLAKSLETLAKEFKVKRPTLVISSIDIGPLIIGFINPTIIIPQNLIRHLSDREIATIISHELAHVKRRDNLWQWIILFMKDLQFFNPFAILIYRYIQLNKELAADMVCLQGKPSFRKNFSNTLSKVAGMQTSKINTSILTAKANFFDVDIIKNRLKSLDDLINKPVKKGYLKAALSITCLVLFFWIKIFIAIKLGHKALLLLS